MRRIRHTPKERSIGMRSLLVLFLAFIGLAAVTARGGAAPTADGAGAGEPRAVAGVAFPVGTAGLRDEAAMVLVGTALIGVAAAVRRAA
jgi:hypothetical protein